MAGVKCEWLLDRTVNAHKRLVAQPEDGVLHRSLGALLASPIAVDPLDLRIVEERGMEAHGASAWPSSISKVVILDSNSAYSFVSVSISWSYFSDGAYQDAADECWSAAV